MNIHLNESNIKEIIDSIPPLYFVDSFCKVLTKMSRLYPDKIIFSQSKNSYTINNKTFFKLDLNIDNNIQMLLKFNKQKSMLKRSAFRDQIVFDIELELYNNIIESIIKIKEASKLIEAIKLPYAIKDWGNKDVQKEISEKTQHIYIKYKGNSLNSHRRYHKTFFK